MGEVGTGGRQQAPGSHNSPVLYGPEEIMDRLQGSTSPATLQCPWGEVKTSGGETQVLLRDPLPPISEKDMPGGLRSLTGTPSHSTVAGFWNGTLSVSSNTERSPHPPYQICEPNN